MTFGVGNKEAGKRKKVWRDAISRAMERREGKLDLLGIDLLADRLIDEAMAGDMVAMKEIGDRIDGKPTQAIVGGDEDDPPIQIISITDQELIQRYLKQKAKQ